MVDSVRATLGLPIATTLAFAGVELLKPVSTMGLATGVVIGALWDKAISPPQNIGLEVTRNRLNAQYYSNLQLGCLGILGGTALAVSGLVAHSSDLVGLVAGFGGAQLLARAWRGLNAMIAEAEKKSEELADATGHW